MTPTNLSARAGEHHNDAGDQTGHADAPENAGEAEIREVEGHGPVFVEVSQNHQQHHPNQ